MTAPAAVVLWWAGEIQGIYLMPSVSLALSFAVQAKKEFGFGITVYEMKGSDL